MNHAVAPPYESFMPNVIGLLLWKPTSARSGEPDRCSDDTLINLLIAPSWIRLHCRVGYIKVTPSLCFLFLLIVDAVLARLKDGEGKRNFSVPKIPWYIPLTVCR